MPENSTGMEFSKRLLQTVMELDKEPTRVAIDYIKNEIGSMM
jgi:hypothetical protein